MQIFLSFLEIMSSRQIDNEMVMIPPHKEKIIILNFIMRMHMNVHHNIPATSSIRALVFISE